MFASNEWTSVASLPNTLFSHAGKGWEDLLGAMGALVKMGGLGGQCH